jgi:hypothetical protein
MHPVIMVSNYRPKWIKIYGDEYYKSCFLQVGWLNDDLPRFGSILEVLVITWTPLVYIELYHTEGINSHIQSYEVTSTHKKSLFLLSQLSNKVVYSAHTYIGNNHLYITMRFELIP